MSLASTIPRKDLGLNTSTKQIFLGRVLDKAKCKEGDIPLYEFEYYLERLPHLDSPFLYLILVPFLNFYFFLKSKGFFILNLSIGQSNMNFSLFFK